MGQINIQTCSDGFKLDQALKECQRANLDVICFQEVRMLNTGSIRHLGYNFYWSGLKRQRKHGVAIAIRDCSYIDINTVHAINGRLMAADIVVRGCKVRVVSCYAPTLQTALSTKKVFYRELHKLSKTEQNRKILVLGDFNAEFEVCKWHSCFDGAKPILEDGLNQSNENAMLLLEYCLDNKMSILNTWFDHPIRHRITWHHPNSNIKKVYDYCLSRSWIRQFVKDVRVRNSYFNSDHRLVVIKLRTPANKAARFFRRKPFKPKPNLELLQNPDIHDRTIEAIENHLVQNESPSSINEIHNHIIECLVKGRQMVPLRQRSSPGVLPWKNDQSMNQLCNERTNLRQAPPTPPTMQKIKTLNKQIKMRAKTIMNLDLKEKGKKDQ